MIKNLKDAVAEIERLPAQEQERAAAILADFVAESGKVYVLDSEELAAIEEALREVERGDVLTVEGTRELLDRKWG